MSANATFYSYVQKNGEMNYTKLERVQCAKDFGVTTASTLKFLKTLRRQASKFDRILNFISVKLK